MRFRATDRSPGMRQDQLQLFESLGVKAELASEVMLTIERGCHAEAAGRL